MKLISLLFFSELNERTFSTQTISQNSLKNKTNNTAKSTFWHR